MPTTLVRTLAAGLNPGGDILNTKNASMWMDAQNIIVSDPTAYLSSVSTKALCATTPPPTSNGTHECPYQQTIATFENADWPSETWAASGTGTVSLVAAIDEGDQALQLACAAGQTATGTGTITSKNLSSPKYTTLVVSTNWDNVSHFSSGYIRIGSDSSNYRSWSLSAAPIPVEQKLFFNWASPTSTVGTPILTAIDYVEINLTATGGGAITVTFDNLCLASFALDESPISNAGNMTDIFVLDSVVGSESRFIISCGDSIFKQDSIDDSSSSTPNIIKGGFTNTDPASGGSSFYFVQFPKSGTVINNILYYVNGKDGYFSYDPNATAGSRHTRISATNYKYLCSGGNMIMLVHADEPNTVYPSDSGTPATITAGNAVTLPPRSGSYITGLIDMDEYRCILRSDNIWKLYGTNPDSATTDFRLVESSSKVGCVEQRMACRVGGLLYFFGGDGIYVFDGNNSTLISNGLESIFDNYHEKLCYLYYNSIRDCVIFCYVPNGTANPITSKSGCYQLSYYLKTKSWGIKGAFDDVNSVSLFGLSWGGSHYSKPLVFEGGLGIYQIDPTTPTDISMPWYIKPQWNDCGDPDSIKDLGAISLFFRDIASKDTPKVTVQLFSDYDESTVRYTYTSVAQVNTLTPTVANNALYTVTINGTAFNYTSDSTATANEIVAGLLALINADGALSVTASGTSTLILTADVAGDSFTIAVTANLTNVATTPNTTAAPENNVLSFDVPTCVGKAFTFKLSGTCTDQKDAAVMISGYSLTWTPRVEE